MLDAAHQTRLVLPDGSHVSLPAIAGVVYGPDKAITHNGKAYRIDPDAEGLQEIVGSVCFETLRAVEFDPATIAEDLTRKNEKARR